MEHIYTNAAAQKHCMESLRQECVHSGFVTARSG